MICSHLVNISTLLGAILSWGILWPLISKQKGEWYPANVPESSMKSLYGYKVSLFSSTNRLVVVLLFRCIVKCCSCVVVYTGVTE